MNSTNQQDDSQVDDNATVTVHVGFVKAIENFIKQHLAQYPGLPATVDASNKVLEETQTVKDSASNQQDSPTSEDYGVQGFRPSDQGLANVGPYAGRNPSYEMNSTTNTDYQPPRFADDPQNTNSTTSTGANVNDQTGTPEQAPTASNAANSGTSGGGTGVGAPFESGSNGQG